MAPISPPAIQEKEVLFKKSFPNHFLSEGYLLKNLELLRNILQYVLGYTNKLHSDVLLFIYTTLPRSTT